jgi:hypothetical protein
MSNNVQQTFDKAAFGELAVAESTPVAQETFSYNVNEEIWHVHENGGTATVVDHQLNLSTGAGANQSAELLHSVAIKYNAGQGACIRFSGLFTAGVTGSTQLIGVGDPGDGLFVGYDGADFGVMRRRGGHQEIQKLTVSAGATSAGNITLTLDGDSVVVALTDTTGDTDITANEIAAHDYSAIGRGWNAHSDGDGVVSFESYYSAVQTGSYTFTDTDTTNAAASFTQEIAGVASTDTWIYQNKDGEDNWNRDKADESGVLPVIDFTKGNVFQIIYQWLGYGAMDFFIEHPATGDWINVHRIEYANANTLPSFNSPTLPLYYIAENTSNTSDIVVNSGSIGGFIQGRTNGSHIHNGIDVTFAYTSAIEKPVITLHNQLIFAGVPNRVRLKLISVTFAADGTKPVTFRIKRNPILTGASYSEVEPGISVAEQDTSATTVTNGDQQFTVGVGKTGSQILNLSTADYFLNPQEIFTVTAQSAGNSDVTVSMNWEERF